ncbi:DUF1642 domain-containing protein [Enterococcus faecalis]|nr:DUF1642 domain-containing protein [Enterococcus faecalis]NSS38939.1 DUF1642 domain-containing protein [Enterococcus faecalis]HAP5736084.1 DUF1642 domain-containing protein [Enterococcus faecalis]HAP5956226.1 DUF1642 domain-containing protein [Enterococcus faecalis]
MNKQELIDILENLECSTESLSYDNGYEQGVYDSLSHVILLDEPKKVVVPKFVAEWIEYAKKKGDSLSASFKPWDLYGAEYGKVNSWIKDNEETYARAWLEGYEVEKEQLYWAVRGVTDYFRCDEKIIVFKKEEEALEVANLIGINTEVKKMNSIDCSECISIEELRNENEEPLFYVALPKIGDTEFCYLWTDTDGAVYTQGNKGLCIGRLKHTEQEIKSIDERYWPFAVKVDGGE